VVAAVAVVLGTVAAVRWSGDHASRSFVATPSPDATAITVAPQEIDPKQISGVNALAADASGGVYFADANGHQVMYRSATGALRTIAGTGAGGSSGDGGPATEAQLERPTSLALATDGTLYVADQGRGQVRAVDRTGVITTVVADVKGAASVAVGPTGDLYVVGADGVFMVRDGTSRLVISSGPGRITVNGQEEAFFPSAVAVAMNGDLWVAGLSPKQLVRFDADGNLLEARDDVYVSFNSGLAAHPDGRVIVADYGRFAVDAFAPGQLSGSLPDTASIANFLGASVPGVTGHVRPTAVTVSPDGAIYVNDDGRGSGTSGMVARIEPDGTVTPLTR
jgi:sugar lactone lactonase YvrE